MVRKVGPLESVLDTPRHQILSTKEIYYPRWASRDGEGASGLDKGRQEAAVTCVSAGVGFKEKKGESVLE